MNSLKWFCLRGCVALIALVTLVSSLLLVSGAYAQTSDAPVGSAQRLRTAQPPFVVAPSLLISNSPTSVAAADLNHDGKLDLVTADVSSGKITVSLGSGAGRFAAGVDFACGCHPSSIAVAELGDGGTSVLLGDASDGKVRVLTVGSGGELTLKQSYAVGISPALVAVGDFHGNGSVDVAVAGGKTSTLAILLNDGKGNLQKPLASALRKVPGSLAIADFNNDGHADLGIANSDGTVSILLGSGNGAFHAAVDVTVGPGALSSIAVGDFDHDGKMDVAATEGSGKSISVLLGKGDGTFGAPHSYAIGNHPVAAVTADVNGDGVADLIAINQESNTFSVLTGNGDGTFKDSEDYVVGKGPQAAVAGDFDGDGHVDLAVINVSAQSISMALGNGDGTFKAGRSYGSELGPRAAASADLNGDKRADLVVTNFCGSDPACGKAGSVAIFLADANGGYQLAHTYALGAGPVSVALLDVDGDGIADIVALNRNDKTVSVLSGKGDGSFQQPSTFSVTDAPVAVAVGDFNRDGKLDLAVLGDCGANTCTQPGNVEVFFGQGDGGFRSAASYPVGYSPVAIAVGDLNNDKSLDLVVANRCGADASCKSADTATVLMGGAGGRFAVAGESSGAISLGNGPASIALGDLSGRGVLDLVVSRAGDNTVAMLRGNGDGTFASPAAYAVGNAPGAITVGDFNGDGKADVAVANVQDSTVSVLFGDGSGKMSSSAVMPVGMGPESLTAVPNSAGRAAALVTANANAAAANQGSDISVLTKIQPDTGGPTTPTISVALTTGTASATYGTSLVFTATVAGAAGSTQPTGTVTFNDASNGNAALTCTGGSDSTLVQNGTTDSRATCTISTLSAGSHDIKSTYVPGADPNYGAAGPSTAVTETVTKATPSITLARTTGSASVVYGTSLTYAATLTGIAGLTQPTGTVTFSDGGTALTCTGGADNTLTQNGTTDSTATCTVSDLGVSSSHSIKATYVPATDPSYLAVGPSSGVAQTVTKATPSITFGRTTGSSSVGYGTSLTYTAVVTGITGLALPTGSVTFSDGGTALSCSNSGALTTGTTDSTATCVISSLSVSSTHSITASYVPGADPNYLVAGPSTAVAQTVTQATPTITLDRTTGAASVVYGTSLTFTATVTGVTGLASPTGSVTFADTSGTLSCSNPGTLTTHTTNSTATCTIDTLDGGSYSITATYVPGADPNYVAAGPSTAVAQTVTPAPATMTITASPSPSTVDQSVTFTVTVSSTVTTAKSPAGKVSFTINNVSSTDCPTQTVNASGKATCTTQSLVAPADKIVATYGNDPNFSVTGATTFFQTVTQVTAQTSLVSSLPTSAVNQQVTFTATVQPPAGGTTLPSGGVTFKQGATVLCSGVALSGSPAKAACPFAFAAVAVSPGETVTATYNGDSNFNAGTPATVNQIVQAADTTSTITSSTPNASNVNQAVTFTATLTPQFTGSAVPTSGTMTFRDTTTSVTMCSVTVTNGTVPNCVYTFTISNTHNITATFNSTDANFNSSPASAPFQQMVNSTGTTVSLTANPTASTVDQQVTFSATVTSASSGAAQPQGSVTYTDTLTGAPLCPAVTLSGGKVPNCQAKLLTATTHTIVARFTTSDANFQSGTSPTLNVVVSQGTPTLSLSASPSSSTVNAQVKFTLTITPPFQGSTVPTGTANFSYAPNGSTKVLCSGAAVSTTGSVTTATCTAPLTATGTFAVTATYSGDTNFAAGTPATASQTVTATGVTVNVTSISPATPTVNQTATFTATVTPSVTGTTLPGGTITFYDATNAPSLALCTTAAAVSGVFPSCTGAFSTQGARVVKATYNGDTNFSSTTSGPTNQTVAAAGTVAAVNTATPNPSVVNQEVTFTASVTANPTGAVIPKSGTMVFTDTSATPAVTICTEAVTSGTVQPCKFTFTTTGINNTHNITAKFTSTDNNFNDSVASGPFPQTVNPSTTKVTISSSATGTLFVNQPVTFNAAVTSTTSGTAIPQGKVDFKDTAASPAVTLCSVTLTATGVVPACTVPSSTMGPLLAGAHSVEAVFTPSNTDFNTATSPVTAVTISQDTPTVTVALSGTPVPASVTVDQVVTYQATIAENPPVTTTGNLSTTYPTGTVTFTFVQASVSTTSPCTAATVSLSGTTTSATCTFSFPVSAASQPYTVTATYNGDSNFVSTSGAATQIVGLTGTSISLGTPNPATATVNQPVMFTATVSKSAAATGSTLPTGLVTFADTTSGSPVTLCIGGVAQSTGVASCPGALRSGGSHTITATYGGDSNFSSSSGTQTETVAQSAPVIKLTAAASTVVATQTINFTAVVSPAFASTGAQAPNGQIVFTSSDGAKNSCSPIATSPGDGTITNSCQFAFLPTTAGSVTVTATFTSADSNFSSGTATVAETVQNFQVAFSPTGPVTVTQGYENDKDPFAPTTITVVSTPASGYSDSLTISCTVQNSSNTTISNPPTCNPNPNTLPGNGGPPSAFTVTAAAGTPVDLYTVTLTATDNKYPGLSQQATLLVNVVAASGTVSLAPGSAATQSVAFNTTPPAGGTFALTLNSFACGNTVTLAPVGAQIASGQISCSGPASPVNIDGGNSTTAAITITVNGTTTTASGKKDRPGSMALAAFWGVPLMAVLAWVARRNSPRRNFFRFLGMVLLVIGLGQGIGCGGHFTRPPTVTGGPPVGSYLVQVVATDSNGINHYAVVPLVVN